MAAPMVLLIALEESWLGISRLPAGLKKAGFEVVAFCIPGSYLSQTRYIDRHIFWDKHQRGARLRAARAIVQAIKSLQPTLVIPGDEEAVMLLHKIYALASRFSLTGRTRETLARSLTDPQALSAVLMKDAFSEFAARCGVRVPKNEVVPTADAAIAIAQDWGYPVVLKQSLGYAGGNVLICHDDGELRRAFESFQPKVIAPTGWKGRLKGKLLGASSTLDDRVSIQQFIQGPTALFSFAADRGTLLRYVAAIQVRCHPPKTGPSCVVRTMASAEMERFARSMAKALNFSGFGGFDFILDDATGQAYALECQPRPVYLTNVGALCGANLPEALFAQLTGTDPGPQPAIAETTVALFPNEYNRDPNSEYLTSGLHDIPWDDPDLVKALHPTYYAEFAQSMGHLASLLMVLLAGPLLHVVHGACAIAPSTLL